MNSMEEACIFRELTLVHKVMRKYLTIRGEIRMSDLPTTKFSLNGSLKDLIILALDKCYTYIRKS